MTNGLSVPRTAVRDTVDAVLDRMPEFVERMCEFAEPYSQGTVPAGDRLRSFRDNAECLLRCLAGTHGEDGDLTAPAHTGRLRARQGVPLEAVLHLFRVGTKMLWDMLLAEARARSPETLEQFIDSATLMWEFADRHSLAFAEAYRDEELEIRRRSKLHREILLDALLDGRGADPLVAAEAEAEFNFPAAGRYVAVQIPLDPRRDPVPRTPHHALGGNGMRSAWRFLPDRCVGIVELGIASPRRLATLLAANGVRRAGLSCEVDGIAELGVAGQFAETALRTLPPRIDEVAVLDERLPEALIASNPQIAQRLAADTIGGVLRLAKAEREVLLDTLETWFDVRLSATRAAELLYCHRNTVLNRLRKIETLTGQSLEDDRHQLACRLALMSYRILPTSG